MIVIHAQEIVGQMDVRAHARISHNPYGERIEPVTYHLGTAALDLASALNHVELAETIARALRRRDRLVQQDLGGWRQLL